MAAHSIRGDEGEPAAATLAILVEAIAGHPHAMLVTRADESATVAGINDAARSLLRRPDVVPGIAALSLFDDLDRDAYAALSEAVAARRAARIDVTGAGADGAPPALAVALAPVRGRDGAAPGLLWTVTDRAGERAAQAALERLRGQGRRREALGQLTNSVAHEFNNVLQIVVGYVDGMRRRLGEHEDAFVRRALVRASEAAERGAALTNRLLTNARRSRPDAEVVDLNAVVAWALARLDRGTGVSADLAADLPPVLCDALQAEIALEAVLANACEATPKGGRIAVRTYLRHAPALVDGAEMGPSEAAIVEIADTGEGMTPEVRAKAADPFFTTREPGRGVGLAVTQGLMRRANGHLAIETAPGKGTTVRLAFPLADPTSEESGR